MKRLRLSFEISVQKLFSFSMKNSVTLQGNDENEMHLIYTHTHKNAKETHKTTQNNENAKERKKKKRMPKKKKKKNEKEDAKF